MGKRRELQALPSELVMEDGRRHVLKELPLAEREIVCGKIKKNVEETYLLTVGRSRR